MTAEFRVRYFYELPTKSEGSVVTVDYFLARAIPGFRPLQLPTGKKMTDRVALAVYPVPVLDSQQLQ